MTPRAVILVCVLAVSLPGGAVDARGETKAMRKQDHVPPIFANGPSIGDPGFEAWLKTHAGPVKLPFTIWREPRRVGAIGVHTTMPASVLRFSDGSLGIPLDDRLRQICGDAEPCRVWLAGRLGESMPMPDLDPSTVFNVHAVHERVEGNGAHAAQFIRGDACLAIRSLKPLHCARGPDRCETCKKAQANAATPMLLDVCPVGDVARPTIEIVRNGKKTFQPYDVLQTFPDGEAARAFAKRHRLTDVRID